MTWEDKLANMQALCAWMVRLRAKSTVSSIGYEYDMVGLHMVFLTKCYKI